MFVNKVCYFVAVFVVFVFDKY